ncbi:hypothetical protein LIER_01581 [Lithospermum erythrorhizon]|uniref:Uncharacterized protein n=1 Tax=Lithospermum erythrorhizon TaxID=34254 RepID=A0AAV3NLG2_LITER
MEKVPEPSPPSRFSRLFSGSEAGEGVDSPKVNQDNDVLIVSSTVSRRRTRASAAALEKKRATLGAWGDDVESVEPDEAMDLEELERLVEEKKAAKKGKGKHKRPSEVESKGNVQKKRKGVVISEPSLGRNRDKFVVDDVEDVEGEDIAGAVRRRSKGKMKVNDDRNRIKNRRITKGVKDMSTEGVQFSSKENEARWNFICARNILPERYLSEATMKNQTYMDIF